MSDAHSTTHSQNADTAADAEGHDTPIKTPKQLITVIVLAFLVPIFAIVLLVKNVGTETNDGAGSEAMTAEAVAERLAPVGQVTLKLEGGPAKTGEDVFKAQCTTCHTAGLVGAPKFGDVAGWAPRVKSGFETLLHSALKGKGAMTAQGGGDFSDYEIARAVVYLANAGGAKFAEPPAPAASAASAP